MMYSEGDIVCYLHGPKLINFNSYITYIIKTSLKHEEYTCMDIDLPLPYITPLSAAHLYTDFFQEE